MAHITKKSLIVIARTLLAITLLACALFLAFSKRHILDASFKTLNSLNPYLIVLAVLAEFSSMYFATINHQRLLTISNRTLGIWPLTAITYASNALSVSIPLAGAELATIFTFTQWKQRGIKKGAAVWTLTFSGIFSTIAFGSLFSLGAIISNNPYFVITGLLTSFATILPLSLLILSLHSNKIRLFIKTKLSALIFKTQKLLNRPLTSLSIFLNELLDQIALLRLPARTALVTLAIALLNWSLDFLCLVIALIALHVPVPWAAILLIYTSGIAAAATNITPGGLGIVELTLTAALVKAGVPSGPALAAVLIYRLIGFWLVSALGWISFMVLHVAKQKSD